MPKSSWDFGYLDRAPPLSIDTDPVGYTGLVDQHGRPIYRQIGFQSPPPHKRSSGNPNTNTGKLRLQTGKPNKYKPHQGRKQRGREQGRGK